MNMTVTNVSTGSAVLRGAEFRDELLTFAGAGTVAAGTLLARDSVSGKLVPFVKGGTTNENGIPKAVVTYDVTAAGAGDIKIRAAVKGEFRRQKLIIAADGNATNINSVVVDQLRDYSIIALDVVDASVLDNQ